jgi:hypothetical protein
LGNKFYPGIAEYMLANAALGGENDHLIYLAELQIAEILVGGCAQVWRCLWRIVDKCEGLDCGAAGVVDSLIFCPHFRS